MENRVKTGFGKKDWILVGVIIAVAALAYLSHYLLRDTGVGNVVVKVNGEIEGVYDLGEDQEIVVNGGTNRLEIKNGSVRMIEADCPDQLCVHQRAISVDRENIICLPNKVIAEVQSKSRSEIDMMTN